MEKKTQNSADAGFSAALEHAPMAFAYFDMSDRLRFWNRAYEDLNVQIRPLIKEGACFRDLLFALVRAGQIEIPDGDRKAWIAHRLERRRLGGLDFRNISDGRTFLCQESHDEMGGTLGVWLDVSHLFESDRTGLLDATLGRSYVDFFDPGCQNSVRDNLQTIVGALELLRETERSPGNMLMIDQGIEAAESISLSLDMARSRKGLGAANLNAPR